MLFSYLVFTFFHWNENGKKYQTKFSTVWCDIKTVINNERISFRLIEQVRTLCCCCCYKLATGHGNSKASSLINENGISERHTCPSVGICLCSQGFPAFFFVVVVLRYESIQENYPQCKGSGLIRGTKCQIWSVYGKWVSQTVYTM